VARDFQDFGPDLTLDLERIEAAGFISEGTSVIYGYSGGSYDITAAFDRMMHLVEQA
jgi:hypothetical protein